MAKLSASQIYTLLLDGGFAPDQARIMTAIAQAESSRDLGAVGDVALQDAKWGPSVGLFQIRTLKSETGTGSDRDIQHLTNNPAAQVQAALNISGGGKNLRPWSTYTNGSYKQHLDTPLSAGTPLDPSMGLGGGGVGGGGFGRGGFAAFGGAAAGGDPFGMDPGIQPSNVTDTDGDGLTDQFEALLGTDATQADSDHDTLSDAYETSVSHTDALSADTDRDGLSDSEEVARGSDAGTAAIPAAARAAGFGGAGNLDSDGDGLSDSYEQKHGLDPFAADSDHDNLSDGSEVARGFDPRSMDSNRDGLTDGFAAEHDMHAPDPAGAGPLH